MRRLTTLFLDLDGTLLDVRKRHFILCMFLAGLDVRGEIPLTEDTYWTLKREGLSDPQVLERHGIQVDPAAYIEQKKKWVEMNFLLEEDRLFPFTLDTLNTLSARARLVLVSHRSHSVNSRQQVNRLGLERFFDSIHFALDGVGDKADLVRAEAARLPPGQHFFVGDTEVDFHAARSLRLTPVLVESGIRTREYLRQVGGDGTLVVRDIRELLNIVK